MKINSYSKDKEGFKISEEGDYDDFEGGGGGFSAVGWGGAGGDWLWRISPKVWQGIRGEAAHNGLSWCAIFSGHDVISLAFPLTY